MSKSQYGFAPQTGTADGVMALKCFVQESINDGQYVAVILRCTIPLSWFSNTGYCVLYIQSKHNCVYVLVDKENNNYMFRSYLWTIFRFSINL